MMQAPKFLENGYKNISMRSVRSYHKNKAPKILVVEDNVLIQTITKEVFSETLWLNKSSR